MQIRSCPTPGDILATWETQFVTERAPFFLTAALRAQLSTTVPVLSRTAFRAPDWPLALVDSYRTYAVAPEGEWVALLSPATFDALPQVAQTALVKAQWQLGRGQVCAWSPVHRYLADWEDEPWLEARLAETDEGIVLLLDTVVWKHLAPTSRSEWLLAFVRQQQPFYPTIALQSARSPITKVVALLANTFVAHSGPNCFATALAASAFNWSAAEAIGNQWLYAAPFLQQLAAQGFRLRPNATASQALQDAVVVWRDQGGVLQHACYVVADGIALNKNGQAWYHPRELVALADVVEYWSDEALEVVVYAR